MIRVRDPSHLDCTRMITQEKPSLDDVYHHGVKGMKWGVRHDRKPTGRKRVGRVTEMQNQQKRRGLTESQKRALKIGAGIAAGVLVAYGGYKLNQMGAFDSLKSLGANTVSQVPTKVSTPRSKVGRSFDEIDSAMVASVNSGNSGPEGTVNCVSNVTAYIMNSVLGMNVSAKGYGGVDETSGLKRAGRDTTYLDVVFDGVKHITPAKPSDTDTCIDYNTRELSKIPNSSTGILFVGHSGGGHVFNYEKDSRGRLTFVDCQVRNALGRVVRADSRYGRMMMSTYAVVDILDCSEVTLSERGAAARDGLVRSR